jgi:hypothetical protein
MQIVPSLSNIVCSSFSVQGSPSSQEHHAGRASAAVYRRTHTRHTDAAIAGQDRLLIIDRERHPHHHRRPPSSRPAYYSLSLYLHMECRSCHRYPIWSAHRFRCRGRHHHRRPRWSRQCCSLPALPIQGTQMLPSQVRIVCSSLIVKGIPIVTGDHHRRARRITVYRCTCTWNADRAIAIQYGLLVIFGAGVAIITGAPRWSRLCYSLPAYPYKAHRCCRRRSGSSAHH